MSYGFTMLKRGKDKKLESMIVYVLIFNITSYLTDSYSLFQFDNKIKMPSIVLFGYPLSFIYSSTLMTKVYHKCHTNVVYNKFMLVLFWEYGKQLGNLR